MYSQWSYINSLCFKCSSHIGATNPNVVFFVGQTHFEFNIKDSKFAKFWKPWAWLGDAMVVFLNFNHYFNTLLNIEKAIFVTSAFIASSLKKLCFGIGCGTWTIEVEAIKGWAKSHLSCNGSETTYDTMVIPYHGEVHQNMLVLEPSHTFHFDSKIGVYDYLVRDTFIRWRSIKTLNWCL